MKNRSRARYFSSGTRFRARHSETFREQTAALPPDWCESSACVDRPQAGGYRDTALNSYTDWILLFSVADHFASECASIDAGEPFFHRAREQRGVRNFAEMFGDEPGRFFRCHPVEMIESGQIHRA
jgi:hypothetical protein